MARPGALRSAGQDVLVAAIAFLAIVSLVFLAGRWHLDSPFVGRILDRAAAAALAEGTTGATTGGGIEFMRTQLAALGEPGAVVTITGAVDTHAVLDSVQPTTDPCLGCLESIAGAARETRSGDPVQVGVRFWTGDTALTVVADAVPVGESRTENITVSLNAGGKVFFDRHCALVVESSEHAVYQTAIGNEVAELFELRAFTGHLDCAELANSTTGEAVALLAVFSYRITEPEH
jgi:hypothetical protein